MKILSKSSLQRRGYKSNIHFCKDKEGNILTNTDNIKQRWAKYFKEHLGENNNLETAKQERRLTRQEKDDDDKEGMPPPGLYEIRKAMKKLKNNKALGPHNIAPELMKYEGKRLE